MKVLLLIGLLVPTAALADSAKAVFQGKGSKTLSSLGLISEGYEGFPGSSVGKESACSAKDPDFIPGSGRTPEEGNGNPLWYTCLKNSMDRGAWQAAVHGVAKSWTRLSDFHFACLLEVFLYFSHDKFSLLILKVLC